MKSQFHRNDMGPGHFRRTDFREAFKDGSGLFHCPEWDVERERLGLCPCRAYGSGGGILTREELNTYLAANGYHT